MAHRAVFIVINTFIKLLYSKHNLYYMYIVFQLKVYIAIHHQINLNNKFGLHNNINI